jgi:hypothetical protein
MKAILPLAAALVLVATPLLARDDSFSSDPRPVREVAHPGPGLYERIAAHYGPMGRDVKEEYRDGPCKITREWETDGDYYERISCRGPRD